MWLLTHVLRSVDTDKADYIVEYFDVSFYFQKRNELKGLHGSNLFNICNVTLLLQIIATFKHAFDCDIA